MVVICESFKSGFRFRGRYDGHSCCVRKDWYTKTTTIVLAKPDDIYLQVQLVMGYRALEKSVQVVEFLLPRTFRL